MGEVGGEIMGSVKGGGGKWCGQVGWMLEVLVRGGWMVVGKSFLFRCVAQIINSSEAYDNQRNAAQPNLRILENRLLFNGRGGSV